MSVEQEAEAAGSKKSSRICHTGEQRCRFWDWLRANREAIAKWEAPQVAEEATKALGFTVGTYHMPHALKATGVRTALQITRAENKAKPKVAKVSLEERVAAAEAFEARIVCLETEVKSLRAIISKMPRPLFS